MERKENTKIEFLQRMKADYAFRTLVFSSLSLLATVAFAGYNAFLAVAYRSVFNSGIAVYYALLVCIRIGVLLSEYKFHRKRFDENAKERARKRIYVVQSILLLLIDLALIAPITLMVMQRKEIQYTDIPAISIAAYTTYKIVMATRHFIRTRKENRLSVKMLRSVNFVDALVSVLSLQYTLILTFGDGIKGKMHVLSAVSSFAVWAFVIILSVHTFLRCLRTK